MLVVIQEEWRDIPRGDGYQVSSIGRVRSCWARTRKHETWRILKPSREPEGYLYVGIKRNGKPGRFRIHSLMLEAFVGPRPEGLKCLHKDDIKSHNTIGNLYYGTDTQNRADSLRNGTASIGSRQPGAKLNEEDVYEIKRLRSLGVSQKLIAGMFGVSKSRIGYIDNGRNWKHVAFDGRPVRARPVKGSA